MSALEVMNQNLTAWHKNWTGARVALVGLGRESWSSYQFIRRQLGDQVSVELFDHKPFEELASHWQNKVHNQQAKFTQLESGARPDWASFDQILVTPGISDKTLAGFGLTDTVIPLTNAELFFRLIGGISREELTIIGVTGTKGKSTTTSAIHHVLTELGFTSFLGGNIGLPILELWDKITETYSNDTVAAQPLFVTLELSSHQIARLRHSPHIAVVQAITPEHLDYYLDFAEYLEAKTGITRYQTTQDEVYFNAESPTATQVAQLSPGLQHGFRPSDLPIRASDSNLPGAHNLINLTPAVLIAESLGAEAEAVRTALKSFRGLPHRLELVADHNDIKYYNDSLATTPEAAMAAVSSFDHPVVLIAGGYDRGLEYDELGVFLSQAFEAGKLRGLVLFPPSGERIKVALGEIQVPMVMVEEMAEAVDEANKIAQPGDVVVMSPAAASFGRFVDYADRGEQFKQAVLQTITRN